jgi:hypothetical protein
MSEAKVSDAKIISISNAEALAALVAQHRKSSSPEYRQQVSQQVVERVSVMLERGEIVNTPLVDELIVREYTHDGEKEHWCAYARCFHPDGRKFIHIGSPFVWVKNIRTDKALYYHTECWSKMSE